VTDDEYMTAVTDFVQKTALWAAKKYNLRATGVMDVEDLESELWLEALNKRDKLEPRLEAGEGGYVVTTLRRAAHDALEPEWKRQAKDGGTLEDLEIVSEGSPRADGAPRTVAHKSPSPLPLKILRTAAKAGDRTTERAWRERLAAAFLATLAGGDREVFRLHHSLGYRAQGIALETGLGVSTVYRRLAEIERQMAKWLAEDPANEWSEE